MTDYNPGNDPAYPVVIPGYSIGGDCLSAESSRVEYWGLTKREKIAALMMVGLLFDTHLGSQEVIEGCAILAEKCADALIARLNSSMEPKKEES